MEREKEVILVTGCAGRIGFKTMERFCKSYRVVGFDVIPPKPLPNCTFIHVDIASDESVKDGLRQVKERYGERITSVIHLAAYYSFTGGGWENYEKITVRGTERLLLGLKDFQLDQFIFSSTMLVHAPCEVGERISEKSLVEPKWDYPLSKVKTEEMIHKLRGNTSTVILRIAGVYDDLCHSIPISNQIQRIYEKQLEARVFPGDITHGASYIHMDDLIDALSKAVEKRQELAPEEVFLIGEPETLSMDDLQRLISRLLFGKEIKTWRIPKIVAKVGAWVQDHLPFFKKSFIKPWMIDLADDNYTLDISHAEKVLQWEPRYRLRTVLPKMIEDLKRDPKAWYRENKLS